MSWRILPACGSVFTFFALLYDPLAWFIRDKIASGHLLVSFWIFLVLAESLEIAASAIRPRYVAGSAKMLAPLTEQKVFASMPSQTDHQRPSRH
jgi:hypothetical protein